MVLFSVVLAAVLLFVIYMFTGSCRSGSCGGCAAARAAPATPAPVLAPAPPVSSSVLHDGQFDAREGIPRAHGSRADAENDAKAAGRARGAPAGAVSAVTRALSAGDPILAGNLARAMLENEVAAAARARAPAAGVVLSADDEARLAAAERRHELPIGVAEPPSVSAAARAAAADLHALAAAHPEAAFDLISGAGSLAVQAPSSDDVDEALAALRQRKGLTVDEGLEGEENTRMSARAVMTEADAAPGVGLAVAT